MAVDASVSPGRRHGVLGPIQSTRAAVILQYVKRTYDDPDDVFQEFADLWKAETAEDLHRVLTLHQPFRSSADWFEPYSLLRRHHKREPHTSTITATLLLTDMRWRKGVGRLVQRIADSGMIEDADLDLLARTFVAAGDHVYWEVPESWFGAESIAISIEHEADVANSTDEIVDEESVEDERVVVARRVHPPLRRWAVAHLMARDPNTWRAVLINARDRSGTDGTAMMEGLFDGLDHVPDAAHGVIIDVGLAWPRANVRKKALERFADLGHRQLAHELALCDPSARIRERAPTLIEAKPTVLDAAVDPGLKTVTDPGQESLF